MRTRPVTSSLVPALLLGQAIGRALNLRAIQVNSKLFDNRDKRLSSLTVPTSSSFPANKTMPGRPVPTFGITAQGRRNGWDLYTPPWLQFGHVSKVLDRYSAVKTEETDLLGQLETLAVSLEEIARRIQHVFL